MMRQRANLLKKFIKRCDFIGIVARAQRIRRRADRFNLPVLHSLADEEHTIRDAGPSTNHSVMPSDAWNKGETSWGKAS